MSRARTLPPVLVRALQAARAAKRSVLVLEFEDGSFEWCYTHEANARQFRDAIATISPDVIL